MSEYEPGTVAVATVRGVENVRVMWDGVDWVGAKVGPFYEHNADEVTDVRPLVVLDLDGAERSVIAGLRHDGYNWLADQIEAQTRPPKPATSDAHDGCYDKGWTEIDGVSYCNNCGFSKGARFVKPGDLS